MESLKPNCQIDYVDQQGKLIVTEQFNDPYIVCSPDNNVWLWSDINQRWFRGTTYGGIPLVNNIKLVNQLFKDGSTK